MIVRELLKNASIYQQTRKIYQNLKAPTHKRHLGSILSFENVPVVPFQFLIQGAHPGGSAHQGGPIWPNWDKQKLARHCRRRVPVDDIPDYPEHIHNQISSAVWCGPIIDHFGHQVAEFSTRILHSRTACPEFKLLFSAKPSSNFSTLAQCPHFFRAMLGWYNVDLSRVEIINSPTMVKKLSVAPQAEQLGYYGPSSAYLDLLDEHVEKRLNRKPRQKILFVSRAGVKDHLAGEAYLERIMQKGGIKVVRPEALPLDEQLALYEASEHLIFSEGSAIHGMQLLGRCLNRVDILNRRPGSRLAKNSLNVRSKHLNYIEATNDLVCDLRPNGTPRTNSGVSILNENTIVDYLNSISPRLGSHWNHSHYLEARDLDVTTWLHTKAKEGDRKPTPEKIFIIEQLHKAGLFSIAAQAENIFHNYG